MDVDTLKWLIPAVLLSIPGIVALIKQFRMGTVDIQVANANAGESNANAAASYAKAAELAATTNNSLQERMMEMETKMAEMERELRLLRRENQNLHDWADRLTHQLQSIGQTPVPMPCEENTQPLNN